MIQFDLKPDHKKLSQFGFIAFFGFSILGLIFATKGGLFSDSAMETVPLFFWSLALLCPMLGILFPKGLFPIYIGLTIIAIPIGLVVSNLILILIFYGLVTPIALFFKVVRRDALNIGSKKSNEGSFWKASSYKKDLPSYYRQF